MNRQTIQRILYALPLFFMLGISLPTINNNLFSDLHLITANRDVQSWEKGKLFSFTMKQWSKVQEDLKIALQLDPANSKIMSKLGEHHKLLARSSKNTRWKIQSNHRNAADYFRQSIALRPISPAAWASLAIIKERLKVIDLEFWNAMKQSIRLGPWEPQVTLPISSAGMTYYRLMPRSMRSDMAEFIQHGFKQHGIRLWSQIEKTGHLELACSLMKDRNLIQRFCLGELLEKKPPQDKIQRVSRKSIPNIPPLERSELSHRSVD